MKLKRIINLACSFKSNIFDLLSSPRQTYKQARFFMDLKDIYEKTSDKTEALFLILDEVLKLRRENPQEFRQILELIDELLKTYEKDPSIKENIKALLNE